MPSVLPATYYQRSSTSTVRDAESFASTSTLVHERPSLSLVFDSNNIIGATLHAPGGPAYRITTSNTVTRTDIEVRTASGAIVATVKRRDLLPDLVMFAHRGGKPFKVKKWLRQPKATRREYVLETLAGQYIWRTTSEHRFALYPEGAPEVPVAYVNALQDPPTLALVIAAGYGDIEVEALTSFIILEHKLRMKEKIEQGELMLALTGNGIFFSAGY